LGVGLLAIAAGLPGVLGDVLGQRHDLSRSALKADVGKHTALGADEHAELCECTG